MGVKRAIQRLRQPSKTKSYLGQECARLLAATSCFLVDLRGRTVPPQSGLVAYDEIVKRSGKRTDISDHLATLFVESIAVRPSLIVELGVRGGESTFVLERVAQIYDSKLVSVDIEDCSGISSYWNWSFIKSDDIAFAESFPNWCGEQGISPLIDILFIDTSHEYIHTLQELTCWLRFLSGRSKVFIHDTNLKLLYRRNDGSLGVGWNNDRGVIAALEAYLSRRFNEKQDFKVFANGWLIEHYANCCGLAILERLHDNVESTARSEIAKQGRTAEGSNNVLACKDDG